MNTPSKVKNKFLVWFSLYRKFIDDDNESLSSTFGIQNEEDNILYFYYHILDVCKGLIEGSINLHQLPRHRNMYFENHEYSYHTRELLQEYMVYLKKEIDEYETYKESLNI